MTEELWAIFEDHAMPDPMTHGTCTERMQSQREVLERRIDHERELRQTEFLTRDNALLMQSRENESHFDRLNNNLRMMLDDRKQFFTRDQHETFANEYRAFRDETRQKLNTIFTWGSAGLLFLALLEFAIRYLLR